jgi:flagellum-specific ATP synthase
MPDCNSNAENTLVNMARGLLSTYDDMAEMIRLGAYRRGTDAEVDRAIQYFQPIEQFLAQGKHEHTSLEDGYAKLAQILGVSPWPVTVK